ncbi:hypothetical protein [Saccharopolyspora kobensis]|uniref:hypothetical protein n=1 Tax=Saccharopolyspora kobensis TaxID=146035 RepID=UPI0011B06C0C|nr:hypothetical protein [Saccharopolyspora kobensis]
MVIRSLLRDEGAEKPDPRGVRLRGARIIGGLDLTDVRTSVPLVLTSCEHEAPIVLERAHLPYLDISDSTFPEFLGDCFICDNDVVMAEVRCRRIRLINSKITGMLNVSGAVLTATDEPALHADRMAVNHLAAIGLRASSDSELGTLRLLDATIPGQLDLHAAAIDATRGPALAADWIKVNSGLLIGDGFRATSNSALGAIRLPGATITGQLLLTGATITASEGPALFADRLTVHGSVHLSTGFRASSTSEEATLRLPGATITGQFRLREAEVTNAAAAHLVLDLASAQVQGDLVLSLQTISGEDNHPFQMQVNGFAYPFIPREAGCQEWLRLLAEHTPEYAAQPYQQLAAVYRAAGHDREVRRILIAQQVDHRRRGHLGNRIQKLLHRANGAFIGYGHRPWRALAFLALVGLVAVAVATSASLLGFAVHPVKSPGEAPTACSSAEAIGLALDTSIPVLKLGGEKKCEIAATGWGQAFYLANYLLQMLGWAFATLFVAGYTGLVRKNS